MKKQMMAKATNARSELVKGCLDRMKQIEGRLDYGASPSWLRELDAVRRRDAEEQKPMSALASAARAYNGREATSAQTELLRTAISDLTGSVGAVALERVGGTLLRFFLTDGDADLTPAQNTVDFAEEPDHPPGGRAARRAGRGFAAEGPVAGPSAGA